MTVAWVARAARVVCASCGLPGPWAFSAHEWEVTVIETRRGPRARGQRVALPLCSAACASHWRRYNDGPVYDGRGREVSGWLGAWAAHQERRAA